MPFPLAAVAGGLQLARGVAGYLTRPKVPRARETARGRQLIKQRREGIYSPTAKRAILNTAGRASADVEQKTRADIRGGLVRGGQLGSISSQRILAQPGLQRSRTLADQGERLGIENELSKVRAEGDFANLQDTLDAQRRGSRMEGVSSLLEGTISAVGAGVDTALDEGALEDLKNFNRQYSQIDLLIQAGKYAEAERLMQEVFGQGGGTTAIGSLGAGRSGVPVQDRVFQEGVVR